MNEKTAKIFEWFGVAVILAGVAFFAYVYVNQITISFLHHAILLWVLGLGILCFIPKSIVLYEEKKDDTENPAAANAVRRSMILRLLCGLALILYGGMKFWGWIQG